eukprot:6474458-Amphidinium_carterae.1
MAVASIPPHITPALLFVFLAARPDRNGAESQNYFYVLLRLLRNVGEARFRKQLWGWKLEV